MDITIVTLFPEMFAGPFNYSILKRAQDQQIITIRYVNIRDFAVNPYRSVDDQPYGGGVGMILRVDIVQKAIAHARTLVHTRPGKSKVILLDPKGPVFTQRTAARLSKLGHIILVCGHYEGFDERIREFADEEISVGNYILTGGEIPAMCVVDSVVRLLPGVLKKPEAVAHESFSGSPKQLEYPQYTRPRTYKQKTVPDILLSGNHKAIDAWKKRMSNELTETRRPTRKK